MPRRSVICLVLSLLVSRSLPAAEAVPIRVLVPNMLEGAFAELQPMLRSRIAAPVSIEYVQMTRLVERVKAGDAADVAIMTKSNVPPLAAQGRIRSQVDVVQSELGIALADGVPLPPMKTTDDFIAFLRATPSIALFGSGASGALVLQFAEKNGLAEVLKRKAILVEEGLTGALVRDGKVASAVQQVGELKFGGANNIVPLPDALQTRPVSSVVVFSASRNPDAAASVAQLLSSPEALAAYRRAGLIIPAR